MRTIAYIIAIIIVLALLMRLRKGRAVAATAPPANDFVGISAAPVCGCMMWQLPELTYGGEVQQPGPLAPIYATPNGADNPQSNSFFNF